MSTGLSTTDSNLASLSTSTAAGLGSLSTSLGETNGNLASLSTALSSGSIGLVQQDAATGDITVAKGLAGSNINVAGTAGDRVITGVAAGSADNDAVNVGQLKAAGLLDGSGNALNAIVYDGVAKDSVTLGGIGSSTPVLVNNVAAGLIAADSMQAVNGGQLYALQQQLLDYMTNSTPQGNVSGNGSTAMGGGSTASGENSTATGGDSTASGENSTALGGNSTASGENSTATGGDSTASGENSTALGGNSIASGSNSTAAGAGSSATGSNSTAMGGGSSASGENSTALGGNASASGSNGTAIGQNASAAANNSVALGAGSVANEANTVSVGSVGNERRITNVAAGVAPTDAVNVGQLNQAVGGMQNQINDLAKNAYSGIAAATALAMIPGVDPGKALSIGIGAATYGGRQAIALGGAARITENLKVKAGVGLTASGTNVGVGASYQW
ncbi:YadA family autotransporter adhesin [Burkholderia thailandensis]|uniref:YadA family autotransporter adhesin n=1 Tax=Burkholderia thailandensis TaxID=57975 RepID=UPI0030826908